ncbi:hypothetical protein LCGC14_2594010 [marine sediment metagenome]|uniref:Ice-binding protein C-terminal domain-containing protein n=1 Tax=marine sediment metagenome TaxID=412755 RepID=A0A0F9AAQ7_9ZZZZ
MRVQDNLRALSTFVVALCITLTVGAFAPIVCADPIVIDSFAAPAAGANFFSFDAALFPSLVGDQPATIPTTDSSSILGDDRVLEVEVVGTPDWKSASGTVGSVNEVLSVATWGDPGSKVRLDYPGLSVDDLTDGGTNDAIAFAFNFLEAGDLNVQITVTGDGGTAVFDSATSAGDVAQSSTPFTYAAPFDEFVVDVGDPLGNADTISIVLNNPAGGPVTNVDFELSSVTAVPEPSTLAMLATLCAFILGAVWRRRHQ